MATRTQASEKTRMETHMRCHCDNLGPELLGVSLTDANHLPRRQRTTPPAWPGRTRLPVRARLAIPWMRAGEGIIDLGGRPALPGLVDAHAHLMFLARARLSLDMAGIRSEEEIASRVASAAVGARPGEWLGGRGWDPEPLADPAVPDAGLSRPCGATQSRWANSAALERAHISRVTGDPPGGLVVKDEDGEPTGVLIDSAQRPKESVMAD
jgi:hypothetical protein